MKKLAILLIGYLSIISCEPGDKVLTIQDKKKQPGPYHQPSKPKKLPSTKDTIWYTTKIDNRITIRSADWILMAESLKDRFKVTTEYDCEFVVNATGGSPNSFLFAHWGKCKYCKERRMKEYAAMNWHSDSMIVNVGYHLMKKMDGLMLQNNILTKQNEQLQADNKELRKDIKDIKRMVSDLERSE